MRASSDAPSLSQRIRTDIEQKILSGILKPGDRIPIEHALATHYGCARMTVTRAMEALAEAGLIVRRRRAGSFVASPRLESVVVEIPDIQANVIAQGKRYAMRLLTQGKRSPTPSEEERLLAADGDLIEIECVHLADDRPFAFEHRLISLTAAPDAAKVDFAITPPGNWLLDHVAWTDAEHRISALAVNPRTAEALQIEPAAACLVLDRWTWRSDTSITWVRQIFPGDAYHLIARFSAKADSRH